MKNSELIGVVSAVERLPNVDSPTGYDSVSRALLDAIYSVGIRYTTVERVIDRYRAHRSEQGHVADEDCPQDLLEV